ncbi:MAG: PIN domain-containing protein [Firmicutes bacterium]|jgi:predicted nucleic acid-binding protein|nr:PIN domain-containing protein [Bacillota bacterium]
MTSVFIDTSAFLAILSSSDFNHEQARATWEELLLSGAILVSSNYVLVETTALVQRRLGMEAVRAFHECVCPVLEIEWADRGMHDSAVAALLVADRRNLSLVDCVSFAIMRRREMTRVFGFDTHFAEQGFLCVPELHIHDR